jgi:hypothetical protein
MLEYSAEESRHFDLRFARVNRVLSEIDSRVLISQLIEKQIDICRLKVDLGNHAIFHDLSDLALPQECYSLLIKQSIKLEKVDANKLDLDIEFRSYTPAMEKELLALVREIIVSDNMNLYYESPLFDLLVGSQKLQKAITQYQSQFFSEEKAAFLGYKNGRLVGFCSMNLNKLESEGVLVGIVPAYRGQGLFKNFINKQIIESSNYRSDTYSCSTIVFNQRSLNTSLKQGLKIDSVILNIHIYPLFKQSERSTVVCCKIDIIKAISESLNCNFFKAMKIGELEPCDSTIRWEIYHQKAAKLITFVGEKYYYGYITYN